MVKYTLLNKGRFNNLDYLSQRIVKFNGSVITTWWKVLENKKLLNNNFGIIELNENDVLQVNNLKEHLKNKMINILKIKEKSLVVGIIGLGYVGLPLAKTFVKNRIKVFGFDTDRNKIKMFKKGKSYINYLNNKDILSLRHKLQPFSSFERISDCDAIILCLPTPIKKNKSPEMKYIKNSLKIIQKYLRKGQILSLESTTYPGTTEEVIMPYLKNFKLGNDFFLVYSPEREDPGNKKFSNEKIPKVVGGITQNCLSIGYKLYQLMGTNIIKS